MMTKISIRLDNYSLYSVLFKLLLYIVITLLHFVVTRCLNLFITISLFFYEEFTFIMLLKVQKILLFVYMIS